MAVPGHPSIRLYFEKFASGGVSGGERVEYSTYVIVLHQMVTLVDDLTLTGVDGVPGKGRHCATLHNVRNQKEVRNTRPTLLQPQRFGPFTSAV